jgi:hypothetical protein
VRVSLKEQVLKSRAFIKELNEIDVKAQLIPDQWYIVREFGAKMFVSGYAYARRDTDDGK